MKIAVIGAGGLGGYFGALLARAGHDVTFVARGTQLSALRASGLTVRGPDEEFHVAAAATDDPADIGTVDLVLFCVKTYDVPDAAAILPPLLGPESRVLTLQNGVTTPDEVASVTGAERVLGGVAYIEAAIAAPGVIVKSGPLQRIVCGPLAGPATERERSIANILRMAGITAELTDDIREAMWRKFLFICPMAGLTALTQRPIGDVLAVPEARGLFADVMREIEAVARREGVTLPAEIVESTLRFAEGLPSTMQSSMQKDVREGKRTELDALNGTVVRMAGKHDIDVPVNRTIDGALRVMTGRRETRSI